MEAKEIFDKIKEGKTIKEIAEDFKVSRSTITRTLKKNGYIHENGEWSEPTNQHNDNDTTTNKQQDDNKKTTKEQGVNKDMENTQLNVEEIKMLKEIIQQHKQKTLFNEETLHLYDRVKNLKEEEKERNNIFLNKSFHEKFEEFLKKEKIGKSIAVELALEDFIKKYSN